MYKKIIFASALIAFVGVQFATSLMCYTCNSSSNCTSLVLVSCNYQAATWTSMALSNYHANVPEVNSSSSFECIRNVWSHPNKTVFNAVYGCAHPTVRTCSLSLKPEYGNQNLTHDCLSCSSDKCNLAGTFSNSFYTVLASVVGLIFVKMIASSRR